MLCTRGPHHPHHRGGGLLCSRQQQQAQRALLLLPPSLHRRRGPHRTARAASTPLSTSPAAAAGPEEDAPLRVVIAGGSPAGLALAAALARQSAGRCRVELHDAGSPPQGPQQQQEGIAPAGGGGGDSSPLVALGVRGLSALAQMQLLDDVSAPQGQGQLLLLQGMAVCRAQGGGGSTATTSELFAARASSGGRGTAPAANNNTAGIAAVSEAGLKAALSAAVATAAASEVSLTYTTHSQLALLDTGSRQATFMRPGGQATEVPFDVLVAADASSTSTSTSSGSASSFSNSSAAALVSAALHELQERQAAHAHPHSAAGCSTGSAAAAATELEFIAWQGMPHDPSLDALLQGPRQALGGASDSSSGPARVWLLAWTAGGTALARQPPAASASFSSTRGTLGAAASIPGAPTCSVLAWSSGTGSSSRSSWSGVVIASPQVFREAVRGRADHEQLLRSVSFTAGPPGATTAGLPGAWVPGITAQLSTHDRHHAGAQLHAVPAAVGPPPRHLSRPGAGLVLLSSAAVPAAQSPQLLNPGVAASLTEAAWLADALQQASTGRSAAGQGISQVLTEYDSHFRPQAAALHRLLAQMSWLRHPGSPAARTAAASITPGSLAWLWAVFGGAPRAGLALQFRCLVQLLPVVAAVQRALLFRLGLGRPDQAQASGQQRPLQDASYRRPPAGAAGAAASGTSLDAGVHLTGATTTKDSTSSSSSSSSKTDSSSSAGATTDSLDGVLIEPRGSSLLAFMHTANISPRALWRLLQLAPLLLAVLWGAAFWFAWQTLRWGLWAARACGWAQSVA